MGQSPNAELIFGFEYPLSKYDEDTYELIPRFPGENEENTIEDFLEPYTWGDKKKESPVEIKTAGTYEGEYWYVFGLKGTYQNAYGWKTIKLDTSKIVEEYHDDLFTETFHAAKFLRELGLKDIPNAQEWAWIMWATYG